MKKLLFIPVAAAALALGVSACGGSEDDAGGSTASTGASAPATAPATAPASAPDGGAAEGSGGQTPAAGGGKLTPAQRELQAKLRDCMVKRGYEMPAASVDNPGMKPTNTNGKSQEQVIKDQGECLKQTMPSMPPMPTGG
ncbi:hypothetical protein [Actinomadura bangladeshensis]|uniref:Uncharacterized protein n=1 Tax=Actinomadura bangladeshensis TaxID=453573 RepID=A0A4R4NES2_9ACTN|nr:hypothetical protein [Actinomadura bangladeshensis]TDC05212.1 hypothetical protein E1284_35780 [Actinomadura bangladeshensis]